jgi:hypothetical protein
MALLQYRGEYKERVLNQFSVLSHANQRCTPVPPPINEEDKEDSDSSSSSSISSEEEQEPEVIHPKYTPKPEVIHLKLMPQKNSIPKNQIQC